MSLPDPSDKDGMAYCKGCEEWFEEEEINEWGFCSEECEEIYDNPRLIK